MHKGMSNQMRPRLVVVCLPWRVDVCQQQFQHSLSRMMCLAALFELKQQSESQLQHAGSWSP